MNRYAAIAQLAVFDAVNGVAGASADAAAIAAAHGVLRHYFPERAAFLDAERVRSLGKVADGPAKAGGITVGEAAAARSIAARENDGSEPPEFYLPSSSTPANGS